MGRTGAHGEERRAGCGKGHRAGGGRDMTSTPITDGPDSLPRARPDEPAWLDPELATLTHERVSDPAWIFERNLAPQRCLALRTGPQIHPIPPTPKAHTPTYPPISAPLP